MNQSSLTKQCLIPILAATLLAMVAVLGVLVVNLNKAFDRLTELSLVTLSESQKKLQEQQLQALNSKAEIIGTFISRVSPDLILAYDFTGLDTFKRTAKSDKEIVYLSFFKPDGSRMTSSDEPEDKSKVMERRFPILNDDEKIGEIALGMSTLSYELIVAESQERTKRAGADVQAVGTQAVESTVTTMVIAIVVVLLAITLITTFLFKMAVLRPLSETTQLISALAAGGGDLTIQLPISRRDEIGELRINLNAFVQSLRGMIMRVADHVRTLQATGGGLAQLSHELEKRAGDQRDRTHMVVSAIDEMVAGHEDIARNSAGTASHAEHSVSSATEGSSTVLQVGEYLRGLAQASDESVKVVNALAKDADKIGVVLEVINDIAEQTNLLALNAAIEAARAGEHGRGFSIVADEVRALASRTRDSTSQIFEVVNRFQNSTINVVDRMKKSRTITEECVGRSTHAGSVLQSMSKMAVDVRSMSEQIAVAIEEHTAVVSNIRQNVGEIDTMAEQSDGSARRTALTAAELTRLTEELDGLIRKFKV